LEFQQTLNFSKKDDKLEYLNLWETLQLRSAQGWNALKKKILFVEDELSLQKSLSYILEKEGYCVISCNKGEDAIKFAAKENPDLILLDLVLPGIDGFEVCKILKRNPSTENILIIMLTGKSLIQDIANGLQQFADDYITKPFEPVILLARIQAVLRRKFKSKEEPHPILRFNSLIINTDAREVTIMGEKIDLTRSEFDLLLLLASKPNYVYSRSQILDHIRQDDYELTERIVDYLIAGVRKKISSAGQLIETIRGIGYKFKI
jgi:two-component system phosphate regulon response regulator PhoB